VVEPEAQLLVVTQNGFGKRTPLSAYPVKGRGIGGVRAIKTTPRTGPVATARVVRGHEELMMISANGIVIRTAIENISERTGRSTSGVILMNLRDGDRLAAIAILEPSNGNGDTDPGGSDLLSDVPIAAEEPEVAAAALPSEAGELEGTEDLEDVDRLESESDEDDLGEIGAQNDEDTE